MSRSEALDALLDPTYDTETIEQEFEFVANKLDFSVDELKRYMKLPKKSFRDYKNQRELYNIGGIVMKKLGMEIGGKR